MYRTRPCAMLPLCDIYAVLFQSDFKSKCRLLLQNKIQFILPCSCPARHQQKLPLARSELALCPPLAHPWPRNANFDPKEVMKMRDRG